jgi:hypothetical protein
VRIIGWAGLMPWPRLWQNLRASRETELVASYPLHVVCYWIGNSSLIAQKHCLHTIEADYLRAARCAAQNPVQSAAETAGNGQTVNPDENPYVLSWRIILSYYSVMS